MYTKRQCAGAYTVEHQVDAADYYTVDISHRADLKGWIAAARWDRHLYTDPVATLADAKRAARRMIDNAIIARLQRLTAANQERARTLVQS